MLHNFGIQVWTKLVETLSQLPKIFCVTLAPAKSPSHFGDPATETSSNFVQRSRLPCESPSQWRPNIVKQDRAGIVKRKC
jgi:hypothetical protein